MRYEIHPSVGVARAGNSRTAFYLAPEAIGGRPIECSAGGDAGVPPAFVQTYKDGEGAIKRQAAVFRVFAYEEVNGKEERRELDLTKDVASVRWTAHLANKKAAWFEFSELFGDLMIPKNSYREREIDFRNKTITGDERRKLIVDPGPRTVEGPNSRAVFDRATIPKGYPGTFPDPPKQGDPIDSLGEIRTDSNGRLLVLGGFGLAGGNGPITSFAGADTWHDDISDGPVRCRLKLRDGTAIDLDAWVLVGSPKFAPELVNIVTLDDIMFDVAVRYHGLAPTLFDQGKWPETDGWNPDYRASFDRDIAPIIRRPRDYQWVANVPTMMAFSAPPFDPRDASAALRSRREAFFHYFRRPGTNEIDGQQNELLSPHGIPLMPINSGTNSVTNNLIAKFLTLTQTQYFLLSQWSKGLFDSRDDDLRVDPLDRAVVGNCVGSPMSPGIEVTWSVRNPTIYAAPFRIAHRAASYPTGLDPSRDECEGGGCEPGDLTKRMAIPWQADFFQCTAQFINFTDPSVNKIDGIPAPPTYFANWWPPQSPMFVMTGPMEAVEQAAAGIPSGSQVTYLRGINSFAQMISAWSYLGFVLNRNSGPDRSDYPSYEEAERNHSEFVTASVAVGSIDNYVSNTDSFFVPMWFLSADPATPSGHAKAVATVRKLAATEAVEVAPRRPRTQRPIVAASLPRTHTGDDR